MSLVIEPVRQAKAQDEIILRATGLRLGYGRRTVLENVDFEVRTGEFWFLIGPNGQGKTTLLRAIMGRLAPLAGRITSHGDFGRFDRIGFVPQQCGLNPSLPTTVREFVTLGLVGIRVNRAEETERLAWALGKIGLAGMESRDYWALSGGQQQRALVARALVRRPRVLVADEPTSGMDLSVEASLLQSLAKLNREERLTVIMVMHDLGVVARYATHVALIHNNEVQAGTAAEVLTPQNLERAYSIPVAVERNPEGAVNIYLNLAGRTR